MNRSPELSAFKEWMAKELFGWDGDSCNCTTCNKPVGGFKDELSRKEYDISGMCQECQDLVFKCDEY